MYKNKPFAGLSLDLDNQWSYMKTHGDAGWDTFPSYLDLVVPRVLTFLKERNLVITFFIVGQDAVLDRNTRVLQSLASAGHEIGNHSFHHEPWIDAYTQQEIEVEIARAEESIEKVTGKRPIGFRGPGFVVSQATLEILRGRGYLYDCSTLPTYIGPLARLYYFMTARLEPEEKQKRERLFGTLKDGFRPIRPYRLRTGQGGSDREMVEIPVTTMPIFKIPIHVSYIIYLGSYSHFLAVLYFKIAMLLCRLLGIHPSLLLHPLDFLGADDIKELSFFPAMNLPGKDKIKLVSEVMEIYSKNFTILPLGEFARSLMDNVRISTVAPERYF
jgi:peptidoglycan-N-acetylglucosamine deacetylase